MENNKELLEKLQTLKGKQEEYESLRNEILLNNLKLVRSRVLRKYGRFDEDLIQSGSLGLLSAIEKFDIKKGTEFSTYAVYWIDQAIEREQQKKKNWSGIPNYKYERVRIAINKLSNKHFEPTIQDIAQETKLDELEVMQIMDALRNTLSLNYEPDDSDSEISDLISIDEGNIEEEIQNKIINEELMELFSKVLTEKQKIIIMLRYGFYDGRIWTLEEVGNLLEVTRERIRQQEAKALRILKNCKEKDNFSVYMDEPDKYKHKN